MKLNDTQLPGMYSDALFHEKYLDLAPEHMDKMFDVLFTGSANLLKNAKSTDRPAAFVVRNDVKVFVAAGIVQYFENADDSNNPGNWSLVWTFDESDIPENSLVVDFDDVQTHSYFIACAGEKYGIQYNNEASLVDLLVYALQQLKKWLDQNVKEGTETLIEQDGVFQARAVVENGEKVFALEPAGEIKNLIKDDTAIEK